MIPKLKDWIPAQLEYFPADSATLYAKYTGKRVNPKYVSGVLCGLANAGLVVRLAPVNDDLRLTGPKKWTYGLPDKVYPGWKAVVVGKSFREKVLDMVTEFQSTAEEVAAEFGISTNSASATLCDLRRSGEINRVGQRAPREFGGKSAWVYGAGPEFVPGPVVRRRHRGRPRIISRTAHIPDPARIAGKAYARQYAGWGVWR